MDTGAADDDGGALDDGVAADEAPPAPRRSRRRLVIGGVILVLGAAAAAAVVLLQSDGPSYPDEWDERVLDLVDFVEDERDLEFEHPVTVEYLSEEEWKDRAEIDEERELDEEDRTMLEHGAATFRALGLAEGDLDLLESYEDLGGSGTVGAYEFEDEKIVVRGEELTLNVKATLVHELTHVLQDQHFDIGDRLDAAEDGDSDEPSPEASLRVLVEGDAERIEDRWREQLSERDREDLEQQDDAEGDDAEDGLEDVPASLVTFFASDYILGDGFVGLLEAEGGERAIDQAFEDPPGPEEHVLNPLAYLRGDDPVTVEIDDVPGTPIDDFDGDFGALSLFLVLAERTDPVAALAAVDGWDGDAFSAYTDEDDRTCVAVHVAGEDGDATDLLEEAFAAWVGAMPAEADASSERVGDIVMLTSCDAGEDADLLDGDGRSQDAIGVPASRTVIAQSVLEGGGSRDDAECFASGLIAGLSYELILKDEPTPEENAQVEQLAQEVFATCSG